MNQSWLNQHFYKNEGFLRPNWETIYADVGLSHKDIDQNELWCEIARTWLLKISSDLSPQYHIHETENFILLTSEDESYVQLFQNFLEHVLRRILRSLPNIASDEGYGKYVVLIFDELDSYYSYISHFYQESGVYGMSSGFYLNVGYGHFVFPHQEISQAESVAAHEMTHALVAHLPIPTWLNEGMAMSIEDLITGSSPLSMDREIFERHQSFWGPDEIQEFWSGFSFTRPDEGQELSYHLAQFAVRSLSQEYDAFTQFVNEANFSDGGESAALHVFGGGLGEMISQFFGEGDWSPVPEVWEESQSNKSLKFVPGLRPSTGRKNATHFCAA